MFDSTTSSSRLRKNAPNPVGPSSPGGCRMSETAPNTARGVASFAAVRGPTSMCKYLSARSAGVPYDSRAGQMLPATVSRSRGPVSAERRYSFTSPGKKA